MPQDKTNLQTIVDGIGNAGGQSGTQTNEALKVLTDRLTKQGKGIASSSTSGISRLIDSAITSTQNAGNLSSSALESKRQRELGFAKDQASSQITTALEQSSGYARQISGLKDLTQSTEKSIRDLNDRYQEAIRLNDSATATRVANLQMKKLEFQQSAEESFYKNLLSVSALSESVAARRQKQTQFQDQMKFDQAMFESRSSQQEKQKGLDLAAKYGVTVSPADTFSDIVNKVAPHVNRNEALQLKVLESQVNKNNAAAQKSISDGKGLDAATLSSLVQAQMNGTDVTSVLRTPEQVGQFSTALSAATIANKKALEQLAVNANSAGEFQAAFDNSTLVANKGMLKALKDEQAGNWMMKESAVRRKTQKKANNPQTDITQFGTSFNNPNIAESTQRVGLDISRF